MTMFIANIERRGEIAILLGASLWGLFWIPVHYLNNIGIDGLWAVVYLFAAAVPISLATLYWGEGFNRNNFKITALIGLLIGLAATLYFSALVYIDVVRVIFLFYLLPIWATILSRIINKEPIGKRRSLAIVVALAGLWLLLSQGRNWPLPQSIGDGMAIASGFFWALCLVVLKSRPKVSALSNTASPLLFGCIFSIAAALIINDAPFPEPELIGQTWPYIMFFSTCLFWPSMFGQIWGARFVPAARAALLTMSEILVATISSYLLLRTTLPPIAIFGCVLIITAVLIDMTSPSRDPAKTIK